MSQPREEVLQKTGPAEREVLDLGATVSPRVLKATAGTGSWGQNDPKLKYHIGYQESKVLRTLF